MTLDEILVEVKKSDNIVIMAHEVPDGDAIGSSLAMCLALRNMGKNAIVLMKDFPENFSFLPGIEFIQKESEIKVFDMAIVLDCPNSKRLNEAFEEYFENAKVKVQFDHHNKNDMFGDYNVVNHVSPATAQILVSSFQYLQIEITKDIATCLLTGVITDTGGFRHEGINPETFEFTADLIRIGVNIPDIYKRVLRTNTRANFELAKRVSNRMEFLEDGKVTFTYIDAKDEEEVGAQPGDHEGLVEIGRDIEGVEVSIFIRQKEKEDKYKVSMRSGVS